MSNSNMLLDKVDHPNFRFIRSEIFPGSSRCYVNVLLSETDTCSQDADCCKNLPKDKPEEGTDHFQRVKIVPFTDIYVDQMQ